MSNIYKPSTYLGSKVLAVGVGSPYSTIQAALDAAGANTTILVGPDTYTDDTIAFTANNQCIVGLGTTSQAYVTQADSTIVTVGAYTGCHLKNIKLAVTAATSAIPTVAVSTGQLFLRDCHIGMTNSNVSGASQPSCISATGTCSIAGSNSVKMVRGTIDYNNDIDDGDGATAIKSAVVLGAGCSVYLDRTHMDLGGSNKSLVITPAYGAASGVVVAKRCKIEVNDLGTTNAVGALYNAASGSGAQEFYGNDLHIVVGAGTAYGAYLLGSATARSMYNHIHCTDTGGTSYSFGVGGTSSVVSQLDDIVAADEYTTASSGTVSIVGSEVDSIFSTPGLKVGYETVTANKNSNSKSYYFGWDSAAADTLTILSADIAMQGRLFVIKDEGGTASANPLTIATEAGETIEGQASITLSEDSSSITLISNGSNLLII